MASKRKDLTLDLKYEVINNSWKNNRMIAQIEMNLVKKNSLKCGHLDNQDTSAWSQKRLH